MGERGEWVARYKSDDALADRLNDLYWRQNLSLERIGELEGVSLKTVHRWMIRLGIPRRDHHDWHRVNVNLTPSKDLAYILGVLLGDGMTTKSGVTRLRTVDRVFANSFYNSLKKVGFRPSLTTEENGGWGSKMLHVTTGCSKDFTSWFRGLSTEDIGKIILKPKELATQFVRGFYESEGWFSIDNGKGKGKGNPRAGMCNTKKEILNLVKKAVDIIGFESYLRGPYGEFNKWVLRIPRPSSTSFIRTISPCIKGVS